MSAQRPLVAMTLGDVAGIGPETVVRSAIDPAVRAACDPWLIGDRRVVDRALALVDPHWSSVACDDAAGVRAQRDGRVLPVLDLADSAPDDVPDGAVSAVAGAAFVHAIRRSAELALAGTVDAVASGVTNKESMHAAGHHYPGQTQVYADACGAEGVSTVLVGGELRVFLLSSHVSLRQACDLVTAERVETVLRQAVTTLRDLWAIDDPVIGVPGLNPHVGDGGLFGDEEIEHVIPVCERLRAEGVRIVGPDPADTLYHRAEQGAYDAVLGLYHDQGTIPLKKYGYITVAAGLPIIRTTAGHGTAYDIAWQGRADYGVMQRATLLAAELAGRRQGIAIDG